MFDDFNFDLPILVFFPRQEQIKSRKKIEYKYVCELCGLRVIEKPEFKPDECPEGVQHIFKEIKPNFLDFDLSF